MITARLRRRLWRAVFRLNGGLTTSGSLPATGCVVVANHCSHADAPALLAALDAGHVPAVAAAADYWFCNQLKAWFCRSVVGGFAVRRDGGGFDDLAARVPLLKAGGAVVVFPTGSRHSADGRFRLGAFRLAQLADVPVVPVWVDGTDRVLGRTGGPHRAHVRIVIGDPIPVADPRHCAAHVQRMLAQPAASRRPSRTVFDRSGPARRAA